MITYINGELEGRSKYLLMDGSILEHTVRKISFAKAGLFEVLLTAGDVEVILDVMDLGFCFLDRLSNRLNCEINAAEQ